MDALDFAPGVHTIYDDVLGRRSGIGIRGAPSRRSRKVLLLEDGVPINASTYLDPGAHYTPPTERLESIDVLKGAGHVLHGPLNNHGIINFINKQPTLNPETTAELSGGELDTFRRHLMHTRTNGPVGLVFAYTGQNADGAFDVEDFQYDDFFTSIDWGVNADHNLGISATYFRERSDYDESNLTPIEFALAPRRKEGRFGQEFNTIAVDYWKVALTHDWLVTDNFSASTQLFFTDLDRPRFTVDPDEILADALPDFVYVDPENEFIPGVQGQMVSRDRHYRTYGAETRFQLADIDAFGLDHTFQWGVRFERHFLDDNRSEGGPGEILTEDNRGPRTSEEVFQASGFSVFLQDALRFGDWTITPGVRAEHYTQNKTARPSADNPTGDRKEEDDNTLILPSLSLLYEGFEKTQLFGNVARGYTPAFARTAEEFPLEPETGINSQIGIRSNALGAFSLEGAVFYNIIQDTVVQEPFTINEENVVVNAADSESYGADFGLRYDSAAATGSDFNFFTQLAYNYTQAEFTEGELDGNEVPEIPEHAGSLTLGFEHTAGWHISASVHHFGSFFTDLANTQDITLADEDGEPIGPGDTLEIREPAVLGEVPSHTIYSARAQYTFQRDPAITLWVQGRNLTDKLFITDFENGIRPGPERTVIAGITVKF